MFGSTECHFVKHSSLRNSDSQFPSLTQFHLRREREICVRNWVRLEKIYAQ